MKTKYYLRMLTSFAVIFTFETLVLLTKNNILANGILRVLVSVYTIEVIIFILINLAGARLLFRPIQRFLDGDNRMETEAKERSVRLAHISAYWTAALGFLPASLWSIATVITISDINVIGIINLLIGSLYGYMLFPALLTYLVIDNFSKQLKLHLFHVKGVLFHLGSGKLWQKLFVVFLVVAFMPVVTILLDVAASGYLIDIILSEQSFIIYSAASVCIAVSIGTFLLTKNLTGSLAFINQAFDRVKKGDYQITLPIIEDDEKGKLLDSFNLMTRGLRERAFIKDTFGKYINPEVADEILKNPVVLSGAEKQVTILFTDIANYTTISEQLTPVEVVKLLNTYFSQLVEIITRNHGVVNKFIGDAVMAVFNDPLSDAAHADHAVQAGCEILHLSANNSILPTRIGINSGKAVVGNIGTEERMEYTVIGDVVNTAQRLEAANKEFGTTLLISEFTRSAMYDSSQLQPVGIAQLKGKTQEVTIYTVV